jgi:hypothetical protein
LAEEDEAANSYQLGLPLHTSQPGSGWSSHRSRNLFKSWQIFWHNYHKKSITKEDISKGNITKDKKIVEVFFAQMISLQKEKSNYTNICNSVICLENI